MDWVYKTLDPLVKKATGESTGTGEVAKTSSDQQAYEIWSQTIDILDQVDTNLKTLMRLSPRIAYKYQKCIQGVQQVIQDLAKQ